jgi:hypothetical protein
MKVLHRAKQLLQGFVLPRDRFDPAWFFPFGFGWKTLELLEDRVFALLLPDLGNLSPLRPLRSFGPVSSWLGKRTTSKGTPLDSTRRNRHVERDLGVLGPRQSLRHSVLFGIPAFVLLGSFVVGGFSDSADATTACTNQSGRYEFVPLFTYPNEAQIP